MIGFFTITAERADGQQLTFTLNGDVWTSDTDVDYTLTNSGSTWTLTDHDDNVETYTETGTGNEALLKSIKARKGYTQTLSYNSGDQLMSVTDSYNRALRFTYNGNLLSTATTPDGLILTYGFNSSGVSLGVNDRLASVSYSTNPPTKQSYLYENSTLPFALTGITDEDGQRYATWTYDSSGRGLTSQLGKNADLTTVSYDDKTGNRTVTNALGEQEVYKFTTLQGVPKVTEIDRLASSTTVAATRLFTYDSNGYTAKQTDWNGNQTTYTNNSHGDPLVINEAVGSRVTRTTTISYDRVFVHLPHQIVTPGLTSTFTYDSSGNLLSRTDIDTTTTTKPYSTNGQTRVTNYTWSSTGQEKSVQLPRTDVTAKTSFTYDGTGALTTTTNALGQMTRITQHLPGGLPETILDPNSVVTNLGYDARQRLVSSVVTTSAGVLTTSFVYDAAGNQIEAIQPDGSALMDSYDTAHRLTSVSDLFNQTTAYTLDAMGDRTFTKVSNSSNVMQQQHSGVFDALGRMLQDIGGGIGQTTSYAYDSNGNAHSISDPLGHVTTQAFDALNRLNQVTQPSQVGGTIVTTYDAHDRPLTVTDPNGGVTSYVYDGFGDVIQQTSPDSGTTVYHYDADGNLTQKTDARGAIVNYTYDALDRVITASYPADPVENVTYAYDQSGHRFGIERLTSLADAAGTLSRSYDERGNIVNETRTTSGGPLSTSYAYDRASRIAAITYPSAWMILYTRDIMGRITAVSTTNPRPPRISTPVAVLSNIKCEPFGPVTALTYGNGVIETRSFDLDYRMKSLVDARTTTLQNLSYGYDPDDNVHSITDGVNSGNSQTLGYDVLDRLNSATGSYGSLGYKYDAVGNRLTQTVGSTTTSYGYNPHSNRLATIGTGATHQTVGTSAAGSITSFSPALGPVSALTYNQANRLATVNGPATSAHYSYDAFGQRLIKVATGTTLYGYDLRKHLLEESADSAITDYIYLDGHPIATLTPTTGKLAFLIDDRLGTPQLATNSTQAIVWKATYPPFGSANVTLASAIQNLRLPGQYFDVESGLHQNGFRDYSPALGRYVETDPTGLTGRENDRTGLYFYRAKFYNAAAGRFISEDLAEFVGSTDLYTYVRNNPTNHVDPLGLAVQQCVEWIPGPSGIPIPHTYLMTGTVTAGMGFYPGSSQGGAMCLTNQAGSGGTCSVVPLVNEQCVNQTLSQTNQPLGNWSASNNCWTFNLGVIASCFPPGNAVGVGAGAAVGVGVGTAVVGDIAQQTTNLISQ
jgi:RHS repeat-associated protein